jgi:hypothetical protein
VNALSIASANLACFVYNYIKDGNSSAASPSDFLPYSVEKKYENVISQSTARIFKEVMEKGLIPPNIIDEIIGVEDLYESIFRVSNHG